MSVAYEKRVAEKMVRLYCSRREGCGALCPECEQLLEYARLRLDNCRYGDSKPSCRRCPVHCYNITMRQRMRRVMKFAGPRMIFYHPLDALKHLFRR